MKLNLFNRKSSNYLFVVLISFLSVFNSCDTINNNKESYHYKIECTATSENPNKNDKKHFHKTSSSDTLTVELGGIHTTKEYHSAPSSILLTGKNAYTFVTQVNDIKVDEYFVISVWRKDKSRKASLVGRGEPASVFYMGKAKVIEIGENGWEKIQIDFEVPPVISYIKFFAYLSKADSAYFDDLTVERFPKKDYPKYANDNQLRLYFNNEEIQKFEEERTESFVEGVHFSTDEWRKGVMSSKEDVLPIKARIKGDWLDHLMGRKWSLRLKIRESKTFKRMRTFSIQTPESRYFLHEYLSHKLFTQEDILTTRYDFAPVSINRQNLGIYAIEEHFAKQLIEFNLRREGPILKFDENPMWRHNSLFYGVGKLKEWNKMPIYPVSRILPFGAGKVIKSEKLKSQFNIAHALLYQYKQQNSNLSEIFDIDKLARYLALTDLTNGKHGATWHNQRFYYNPVLCKMEIINYDNFTGHLPVAGPYPDALNVSKDITGKAGKTLYASFFKSRELLELYIYYLEKYTEPSFSIDFYKKHQAEIEDYLVQIKKEFPYYHIDSSYLANNAKVLRSHLNELKSRVARNYFDSVTINNAKYGATAIHEPKVLSAFVNSYYYKTNESAKIDIENYNGVEIELIGIANSESKIIHRFPPKNKLNPYKKSYTKTSLEVPFQAEANQIAYKTLESDSILFAELSLWKKNIGKSPYQELLYSEKSNPNQLFSISNDSLILNAGIYSLTEKILIPKGKKVIFKAGVELDMVQKAAIISHSPVYFQGSEEKPIIIKSSDYTANGFTVLQAKGKSAISNTTFTGLNTLNYKGWELTGAVNFYESDVDIDHTIFENNQCEDALNIVRSHFNVSESKFYEIYADAFDSDFCTGLLENSKFDKVGNDAIDFSTSQITIKNCEIINISDKGISGGEASTLTIENCDIQKCNIGVASKDLSTVSISNSSIQSCEYGFVALKKKPEYGGAIIISKETGLDDCTLEYLIEEASVLHYDNKKIIGVQKNVSALFY